MLRKLILTETEKKQISSLHHLINEEDGFATLQGYVKYKTTKVPNSQVKLFQNEKIIKGATSDENGFFKIENIPLGKYTYKVTNKVEGYEDTEEEVDLTEPKVYNVNYFFRDVQSVQSVTVGVERKAKTFLDVSVFDSDGKPLGPCKIEVFNSNNEPLIISKNTTDDKGVLNFIEISDTNPGFEISKDQKQCEKKESVSIRASYNNVNNLIVYELCIFNGRLKDENGVETPTRYFSKNADGEVVTDTRATNIVKINLNTLINYQIRVRDKETEEVLKTATVKIFTDKEKTKVINQGNPPLLGQITREKLEDGEFENEYKIYYEVNNDGYEPKRGKINVSTKKNNNVYVDLEKVVIKPPKPTPPPKPLSERECIRLTMKHYRNMQNVDAGNITINDLGGVDEIKKNAEAVKACYVKYIKEYPRRMEKTINRLKNVQSELDFFKLRFTNQEIRSIYGESRTMLLKNTIRKVVSESV